MVHSSARHRGIAPDEAIHAAEHPVFLSDLDEDSPARQFRYRFDDAGRLLEVVVLLFDRENELLIHAMKARPQYLDRLDRRARPQTEAASSALRRQVAVGHGSCCG